MNASLKLKLLAAVVILSAAIFFLQRLFLPLSLINSEWQLTELDGTSIGDRAILEFGYLANSVTGNDGCNGFHALLSRADQAIGLGSRQQKFVLDQIAMTLVACRPNPYSAHLFYAVVQEPGKPLRLQLGGQIYSEALERSVWQKQSQSFFY